MRVVVAMIKHETNTFSPVPTPLERFGDGGPYWGDAAYRQYKGTATPIGAYIELAEQARADIAVPVAAEAWPSGPVAAEADRVLSDAVAEEVAKGCDIVLLDLHGAMVTETSDDGEGSLVARVRSLAPEAIIAVALDLHGNLTDAIVDNADIVVGFKTYPHTDMYETGRQAGEIAFKAYAGACRPVTVWGNKPMLPHIMRQGTDEAPMRGLIDAARAEEAAGLLAASVFGGFPHADIHDAGLSVVTIADGNSDQAEAARDRILDLAWRHRADFVYRSIPAHDAIARAKHLQDGPILLLDHCDNCGSGGAQDVMTVLGEMIDQDLENAVAFAIHDPEAVAVMEQAGIGAQVTLPLGGRLDMPSIGLMGRPLTVSGQVRLLSDGRYTIRGPMYTGVEVVMGRTAVLDTGKIQIVVIDRHHEPWDVGCLHSLGIDPAEKRFIMLKSRVHWRAGFWPVVRHVVECAGPGVTTSDYDSLTFAKVRRPIYPLDHL